MDKPNDSAAPKNKGGRPKGSKNAATLLQEAVLQKSEGIILEHFPKIVTAVVNKAKEGDMVAAKMIMDRVIPARKAIEHRQAKGNQGVTIVVNSTNPKLEMDGHKALIDNSIEVIENEET